MSILSQWQQSKDKLEGGKIPFFYVKNIGNILQLKVWTQTGHWVLAAVATGSTAVEFATGKTAETKDNIKRLAQAEQAAAFELRRLSALVEGSDE